MSRKIKRIIIHCSATDLPHGIHDIDRWHKNRGFKRTNIPENAQNKIDVHIGYHRVILKSGEIKIGRDDEEIGAHCFGFNSDSIGICFVGSNLFTNEQFDASIDLIKYYMKKYNIQKSMIFPHCKLDKKGKTCPQFDINDKILNHINEIQEN